MQIRSFSGPYFPVFSPNTGKFGPEKIPHLDTFQVVTTADNLGLYVCQSIALPISLKNMNFTLVLCNLLHLSVVCLELQSFFRTIKRVGED